MTITAEWMSVLLNLNVLVINGHTYYVNYLPSDKKLLQIKIIGKLWLDSSLPTKQLKAAYDTISLLIKELSRKQKNFFLKFLKQLWSVSGACDKGSVI